LAANKQNVNGELMKAILAHKVVVFVYDDCIRVVEPYAYGTTQDDNAVLSAYQTGGYSQSSGEAGWRTFRMDKIDQLTVIPAATFKLRNGYDKHVDFAGTLFTRAPAKPTVWQEE
jgi:predicted DNA-binding transcriptional regulator YafY